VHRLELKVPPLALFGACVATVVTIALRVAATGLDLPGLRWSGAVVLLAGVFIAVSGVVQFRRVGTTVNPMSPDRARAVVRDGVYRLSRNPMYLGMAAALIGLSLLLGSWAGLPVAAGFCAYLSRFQILPEERMLLASFGEPYARYMDEVRRWL